MILKGGADAIARFRPIIQVEVTKTSVNLPPGYKRFSVAQEFNHVFIPSERVLAIKTAEKLGWPALPN